MHGIFKYTLNASDKNLLFGNKSWSRKNVKTTLVSSGNWTRVIAEIARQWLLAIIFSYYAKLPLNSDLMNDMQWKARISRKL